MTLHPFHPYPGFFLSLEGGEGSGKTSLAADLSRWLIEAGQSVVTTKEPGGYPIGDAIRQLVLHPPSGTLRPLTQLFLFEASRAQHVDDIIRPALQNGAIVLCDRYIDSTVAYQGNSGIPRAVIDQLNALAIGTTIPNLTLWADVPVAVGLARRHRAGSINHWDLAKEELHTAIRNTYAELAHRHPHRFVRLNSEQPYPALLQEAQHALRQALHQWRPQLSLQA